MQIWVKFFLFLGLMLAGCGVKKSPDILYPEADYRDNSGERSTAPQATPTATPSRTLNG